MKQEAGKKIPHAENLPRVPQTVDEVKDCDQSCWLFEKRTTNCHELMRESMDVEQEVKKPTMTVSHLHQGMK